MTQETVNIFGAAMSLPAKDRAELAEKLLESLTEAVDQSELDTAWAEESLARLQAYDEDLIDRSMLAGLPGELATRLDALLTDAGR
jgi:putative addiction module component (TIGR02574 family)